MNTKITLEDKGQDLLSITTDKSGLVIETNNSLQTKLWGRSYIPISNPDLVAVGKLLPIHHPPEIQFGYLKYKITKIEKLPID